jgi:Tfp pilus assembly protein PilV
MIRVQHQAGFTFNELLVAMNIIVVGVLAYSISAVGVIRGQAATDNLTVAMHLAQDKLEQLKAERVLANDDRCPGAGDLGLTATGAAGGIFNRCWKISDSTLGTKLKQIDVTVSWQDQENRQVTISTLVFIGGDS